MSVTRRLFVLAGLSFAGSAATSWSLLAQDGRPGSVHPPDPAGHELDMILRREPANRQSITSDQRDVQFHTCLQQILDSATKLRDQLNGVPLSEVLSVHVYRETQALERLVKQLKTLAKS